MDSSGTGSTGQQKLPTSDMMALHEDRLDGGPVVPRVDESRNSPNQFCYINMTKAMQAHDSEQLYE
jgi:hypothetical protein